MCSFCNRPLKLNIETLTRIEDLGDTAEKHPIVDKTDAENLVE
jgi:hypothetical protein